VRLGTLVHDYNRRRCRRSQYSSRRVYNR